jgi:hypothetical protein
MKLTTPKPEKLDSDFANSQFAVAGVIEKLNQLIDRVAELSGMAEQRNEQSFITETNNLPNKPDADKIELTESEKRGLVNLVLDKPDAKVERLLTAIEYIVSNPHEGCGNTTTDLHKVVTVFANQAHTAGRAERDRELREQIGDIIKSKLEHVCMKGSPASYTNKTLLAILNEINLLTNTKL